MTHQLYTSAQARTRVDTTILEEASILERNIGFQNKVHQEYV